MTQAVWWTEAEVAAMKQELARPAFRRSALENAYVRYCRRRNDHVRWHGTPFLPFHEWAPQEISRRDGRVTHETVRELLEYDPITGVLTYQRRGRRWFKSDRDCNAWNTQYAGKPAGWHYNKGYMSIILFGRKYLAHRVIFFYMMGRWPDPEVDHENHDGTDNRWCNLFEKTHEQNGRNHALSKRNKSGRTGVRWFTRKGKFVAKIGVGGHHMHLGYHDTFEEACAAREAAEREHGFHKNHGKARTDPTSDSL